MFRGDRQGRYMRALTAEMVEEAVREALPERVRETDDEKFRGRA